MRACVVVASVSLTACSPAVGPGQPSRSPVTEATLRAADELQRRAVFAGDVEAVRAMMHPRYRVNAPNNRVMTREEILGMYERGIITAEPVQRVVEVAVVSGMTGLVMGQDTLVPPPGSELAKAFGERPLLRRFTNVYTFENGKWWFLGRHFSQARG